MFKSFIKKRITSLYNLRDHRMRLLLIVLVVCFVLYLIFQKTAVIWACLGFCALALILHIFTAKLKLKAGDVVLFFGLPGSGKTMFLSKIGYDNIGSHILVNEHFASYDLAYDVVERETFGMYDYTEVLSASPDDPGGGSGDVESRMNDKLNLLLWDEASLNGFDNRDWQSFDCFSMEYLKRIRKYNSAIAFSNQGWDELDKKIRNGLCSRVYYCVNRGFYSVAYRLYKEINISELSSDILEGWRYPSLLERLADPSVVLYAFHRKYGKHYDTLERATDKPLYQERSNLPPPQRPELKCYFQKKTTRPANVTLTTKKEKKNPRSLSGKGWGGGNFITDERN